MRENIGMLDDLPSHRWETVALLVECQRKPNRRTSDKFIHRGFNFLKRYSTATALSKLDVRRDYPDLYWAYGIYDNPNSERWIIEAGLLTDISTQALAKYVGKPLMVIQTYEKMFYDVRSRLDSRGYMLNRIMMPAFDRGVHARDFDLLYKILAYCMGWKTFTEFIDSRPLADETRAQLSGSFQDRMLKLGWMAAHRLEINNYNAIEVIDKCIRLREVESQQNLGGAGRDEVMGLLGGLLDRCVTTMLPIREVLQLDEPRVTGRNVLKYGEKIPIAVPEPSTGEAYDGEVEQG